LTPFDVVNAITAQKLTLPSGTEKIDRFEYLVGLNSSPDTFEKLNAIPIKSLPDGTTIYIRDVANIVNGSIPKTNIVRFNGRRAAMLDIQKTGSASTLDIVQGVKNKDGEFADLSVAQWAYDHSQRAGFRNARGHGKVLTHRQLLLEVWGAGYVYRPHYLRVYMANLRQKPEDEPTRPRHIITELQVGYRLANLTNGP
jgi:hypothetical protein